MWGRSLFVENYVEMWKFHCFIKNHPVPYSNFGIYGE